MNLPKSKRARFCQCPKMLRQGTYHPERKYSRDERLRKNLYNKRMGKKQ